MVIEAYQEKKKNCCDFSGIFVQLLLFSYLSELI